MRNGAYALTCVSTGKANQRTSAGCGDFYVAHTTWVFLVEDPLIAVSFLLDFLNILYKRKKSSILMKGTEVKQVVPPLFIYKLLSIILQTGPANIYTSFDNGQNRANFRAVSPYMANSGGRFPCMSMKKSQHPFSLCIRQ